MNENYSDEIIEAIALRADGQLEETFEDEGITSGAIAYYLQARNMRLRLAGNLPELNIELLRHTVEWARKRHDVPENFVSVDWNQEVWAKTTLPADQVEMKPIESEEYDDEKGEYVPAVRMIPVPVAKVAEDFCGTACCIAGNIAMTSNKVSVLWETLGEDDEGNHMFHAAYVDNNGEEQLIEVFARNELGLSSAESSLLFSQYNSIEDVEMIAAGICEGRGIEY